MARQTASALPRFYGSLQAAGTIGSDVFAAHDGTQSWDDGGIVQQVMDQAAGDLQNLISDAIERMRAQTTTDVRAIVADQVRDAIHEYASNTKFDLTVIDGALCVACDMGNVAAVLHPYVPVSDLIGRASQMAASDPQFVSALTDLATRLMGFVTRAPMPAQAPAPVPRAGGRLTAQPQPQQPGQRTRSSQPQIPRANIGAFNGL